MAGTSLLVHFISDFLRDPELRCAVLKDEDDGLRQYGLNEDQITRLRTFDTDEIIKMLRQEITDLGIDMETKGAEIDPDSELLSTANVYQSGGIHPYKVIPKSIRANERARVTICGNGFDKYVRARFVKDAEIVNGATVSCRCDIDLYQRLEVEVQINREDEVDTEWEIQVCNLNTGWFGNTKNPVKITVIA